jgi:DNA repair protein RecO (recombination protein O)
MLHKTRGIVLSTTDYGESSIVAKIYTEVFGLQSYLVNSVRKKNPKVHYHIFQPLTPVELVVYHKERPGLQRISEIRPAPVLSTISFDIMKTTMILFLAEMIAKSIREEESNDELFEYIYHSIILLDESETAPTDFHLLFLIRLTRFLGFFPINNFGPDHEFFDIQSGTFEKNIPPHQHYLEPPLTEDLSNAISKSFDLTASLNLSMESKRSLLDAIIEFYQLHIENFGKVHSKRILEEVFS